MTHNGAMERPLSITRFERLYLGALALSVVGWWLTWGVMHRQIAGNPALVGYGWVLPAFAVLWVIVWLALSWWVALGGSAVPKWIVIGLAAIGILRLLISAPAILAGTVSGLLIAQGVATLALILAAAAQLFRADARLWLGEGFGEDVPLEEGQA